MNMFTWLCQIILLIDGLAGKSPMDHLPSSEEISGDYRSNMSLLSLHQSTFLLCISIGQSLSRLSRTWLACWGVLAIFLSLNTSCSAIPLAFSDWINLSCRQMICLSSCSYDSSFVFISSILELSCVHSCFLCCNLDASSFLLYNEAIPPYRDCCFHRRKYVHSCRLIFERR